MKIEHIGLWTKNLETMHTFYDCYFNSSSCKRYDNLETGFSSYFLTFETGARLELMHRKDVTKSNDSDILGFAHLAISLGSKENVDSLTKKIVTDGYTLLSPCRTTGDGYSESVIADPEGNRIELTI